MFNLTGVLHKLIVIYPTINSNIKYNDVYFMMNFLSFFKGNALDLNWASESIYSIEFFTINTKLSMFQMLPSKSFSSSK